MDEPRRCSQDGTADDAPDRSSDVASWDFPDPLSAGSDDILGLGADLEPATLLQAYRRGIFPMPLARGGPIAWWSPDPRAVLLLDQLHVSRSLRKSMRRYEVHIDRAFGEVLRGCADPRRENGWIDERIASAYLRLHELGWAHSVEAWDDQGLAGGLYGVAIGGLFAGESMFHRRPDASKVALAHLVQRMCSASDPDQRLLDVQFLTAHLESLGATEIPRVRYLGRLQTALARDPIDWTMPTPE